MEDGSEQSEQTQLFIKVVESINYASFVSEKKPISSRIQKYLFKKTIDIQDGLLEIFFYPNWKKRASLLTMETRMNRHMRSLKI